MSRAGRVEAATRSFWGIEPEHQLSAARNTRMDTALTASDALLRTDEAVERVARLLVPITYGVTWSESASGMRDTCRLDAYEIITALLGEAS